jgi:hypothetical protein
VSLTQGIEIVTKRNSAKMFLGWNSMSVDSDRLLLGSAIAYQEEI